MFNFTYSRFTRILFFSFVLLVAATPLLYPQASQTNKPAEKKEAAGIITKEQAVSGPVWIFALLPVPDSSRVFSIKDAKGNEVKLTTKELELQRNSLYIPEGYKLNVDRGSYYWHGYSLDNR